MLRPGAVWVFCVPKSPPDIFVFDSGYQSRLEKVEVCKEPYCPASSDRDVVSISKHGHTKREGEASPKRVVQPPRSFTK